MHTLLRISGAIILLFVTSFVAVESYTGFASSNLKLTVPFQSGTSVAAAAQPVIEKAAQTLIRNDRVYAVIVGHTGTRGDTEANRTLAYRRAEAVKKVLLSLGVEVERLEVLGAGGEEPLDQQDGESDRAYQNRLARVDITVKRMR